ncbi:MAG: hypothetical protein GY804_01810 [Alphaproteobacteria bacterium]|nr:hypothetical protein [Alphaproteobacteria bacterium]
MIKIMNAILLIATILIVGSSPVYSASNEYKGDGNLIFKEAPYDFCSSGYMLYFEPFLTSNDFEKSYSINNLPTRSFLRTFEYILYFNVKIPKNKKEEEILPKFNASNIDVVISDDSGKKIFHLTGKLADFISTNGLSKDGEHLIKYYFFDEQESEYLKLFNPNRKAMYTVDVRFISNEALKSMTFDASFSLETNYGC